MKGVTVDDKAPTALNHRASVASDTAPVLTAEGIEKSFRRGMWPMSQRHSVLKGVDLTLSPGEVVGLVGEKRFGQVDDHEKSWWVNWPPMPAP